MSEMFKAIESLSYEEAFAELEDLVRRLEEGQQPLEEAIRLFERGQALIRHCQALLDQAELRIRELDTSQSEPYSSEEDISF